MSGVELGDGMAGRLSEGFRGTVLEPADAGYEDARAIFNSMIESQPAVIAQCAGPDDVATAIAFGRESGLEIAVRSGGHSVAGASLTEGGLVIDMRKMNTVGVDPGARTATVGGGASWRDVSTRQRSHMAWPRPAAASRPPEWPVSPWAAAPGGSSASSGSRATTCSRSSWQPRTVAP